MKDWEHLKVSEEVSILETIRVIDKGRSQVAVVTKPDGKLAGIITDGDVRRAILKGIELTKPVTAILHTECEFLSIDTPPAQLFNTLRQLGLRAIPLVRENQELVGLSHIDDFLAAPLQRENPVVLMAGGLGTRLKPLTNDCPKPMLRVGDKPILELIIENFVQQGFKEFFLSVNYKAEVIENHFGNGEKFGVSIHYLREEKPLGTAGSLALLKDSIKTNFIVSNGDVLTKLNAARLLEFHEALHTPMTVCVREHELKVPFAVMDVSDNFVNEIREKPVLKQLINTGIYALNPKCLDSIPHDAPMDMPDLVRALLHKGQNVGSFLVHEYWSDIGHPEDFHIAQNEYFAKP